MCSFLNIFMRHKHNKQQRWIHDEFELKRMKAADTINS